MKEFSHKPVMLEECMEGLSLYDGGIWFDGTVGGGGHSYEILKIVKQLSLRDDIMGVGVTYAR